MKYIQSIGVGFFTLFLFFQVAPAYSYTRGDICDLLEDGDLESLQLRNVTRIKSFNVIPASRSTVGIPIVNQSCEYLADESDVNTLDKIHISVKNLPIDMAAHIKSEYRASYSSGRLMKSSPSEGILGFSDEAAECVIQEKFMSICEGVAGRSMLSVAMFESSDSKSSITQDLALRYFHVLSSRLEAEPLADLSAEKLATWEPTARYRFDRMPDANVGHDK
jgi:hypothetical protein